MSVPLLQRYLAAAQKLVPDLEKRGLAVVAEWGCPNPGALWIAAIAELPAWLAWNVNAGTPPGKLPWIGPLLLAK